jgi:hypothetical protein
VGGESPTADAGLFVRLGSSHEVMRKQHTTKATAVINPLRSTIRLAPARPRSFSESHEAVSDITRKPRSAAQLAMK